LKLPGETVRALADKTPQILLRAGERFSGSPIRVPGPRGFSFDPPPKTLFPTSIEATERLAAIRTTRPANIANNFGDTEFFSKELSQFASQAREAGARQVGRQYQLSLDTMITNTYGSNPTVPLYSATGKTGSVWSADPVTILNLARKQKRKAQVFQAHVPLSEVANTDLIAIRPEGTFALNVAPKTVTKLPLPAVRSLKQPAVVGPKTKGQRSIFTPPEFEAYPDLSLGTINSYYFSPHVRQAGEALGEILDPSLYEHMVRLNGNPNVIAPSSFPGARRLFNRVVSALPWRGKNPEIETIISRSMWHGNAEQQRMSQALLVIESTLGEAFRSRTFTSGIVDNRLRAGYKGVVGPDTPQGAKDVIGSLLSVMDNPSNYDLSAEQKWALKYVDDLLRNERLSTGELIGESLKVIDDSWVAHSADIPERVVKILGRSEKFTRQGSPLFRLQRERRLSTEEFIRFIDEISEEGERLADKFPREKLADGRKAFGPVKVEVDITKIMASRLQQTANARTEAAFAKALTKKLDGKRIPRDGKIPSGRGEVTLNNQRYHFSIDDAQDINNYINKQAKRQDANLVKQAIETARSGLLNLDAGVVGRQGFLAFSFDPRRTIRDYGRALELFANNETGWLHFYGLHGHEMSWWAQRGAIFNVSAIDVPVVVRGATRLGANPIDRLPIIRTLNHAQFQVLMTMQKLGKLQTALDTLKAARDGAGFREALLQKLPFYRKMFDRIGGNLKNMTDDALAEIAADGVNNLLGGINQSPQNVIRKAALLTEGWLRAQAGVMINAGKVGPKGMLARRMLMQEMMLAAVISTAISKATTGELPDYDPRSSGFLDVKYPGGRFSVFPHKTIVRMIIRGIAGKAPNDFGPAGHFIQRTNEFFQFIEGRIGQVPRMAKDLTTGKDFFGRDIDNKWVHTMRSLMPIIVQQLWDDMDAGSGFRDTLPRAGLEFLGFNPRDRSITEKLDNWITDKNINAQGQSVSRGSPDKITRWYDAEPGVRGGYMQLPDVQELREQHGDLTQWEKYGLFLDEVQRQQQNRDADLLSGYMSPDAWRSASREAAIKKAAAADLKAALVGVRDYGPQNSNEHALTRYYQLGRQFYSENVGTFDHKGWREAEESWLERLPEEQRSYIERNLHPNATPLQRRFNALKAKLRKEGYYDYQEQDGYLKSQPRVASLYDGYLAAKEDGRKAMSDWLRSTSAELKMESTMLLEAMGNLETYLARASLSIRINDPSLDVEMVLFYDAVAQTVQGVVKKIQLENWEEFDQLLVLRKGQNFPPSRVYPKGAFLATSYFQPEQMARFAELGIRGLEDLITLSNEQLAFVLGNKAETLAKWDLQGQARDILAELKKQGEAT